MTFSAIFAPPLRLVYNSNLAWNKLLLAFGLPPNEFGGGCSVRLQGQEVVGCSVRRQ
ncbi:MAG: hypothetical protein WCS37_17745 [Chloroflexota bacterium]|nr:hypothetical protein [Chloroflexota bacterium]